MFARLKARLRIPAVAREGAVYAIAGTVNRAAGLVLLPLYTRDLTKAEVGGYGLLTSVLLLCQIVTVTGLDSATARWFFHLPDARERERTFSSWILWQGSLVLLIAVPTLLGAPLFSRALIGNVPGATRAVRFAALALVAGVLPNALFNWFRLHRRPAAAGLTATSQAVGVALASIVTLGILDLHLPGVFIAQFVVGALISVAAVIIERAAMLPLHATRERIREMLRFALPLVPAGAAFWIIGVADRLFLRAFSDLEQVGRYQVVATVAAGVGLFTQAFQLSWGPAALSIQDRPNARRIYRAVLDGYLLVGGLICFAAGLLGTIVIGVVAAGKYSGLLSPLVILTASVVFQGVLAIVSIGPTIVGTSRPTLDAVAVAAVVNTVLNLTLIPPFGLMGAAWATMLAMVALALVGTWRSERMWRVGYDVAHGLGIVGGLALMTALVTYAVESLSGGLRVTVLALVTALVAAGSLLVVRSIREALMQAAEVADE